MSRPAADAFPDWPRYAARIRDAVRDLTLEQLGISAGPEHGPIWLLAAHVAGTRVYWLCHVFGEPGADRATFIDPTGFGWDDEPEHPRSGEELAWALDTSWSIVEEVLHRWSLDDLGVAATRVRDGIATSHTRASVLNRILSHDAFHAGEISQLLGRDGIGAIDLWRRSG